MNQLFYNKLKKYSHDAKMVNVYERKFQGCFIYKLGCCQEIIMDCNKPIFSQTPNYSLTFLVP